MLTMLPTLLAQSSSPGELVFSVGSVVLGLVVVVVVGWFVVVRVRSWMKTSEESGEAFTLDDLRRMHRAGEISEAEFQRAREAMIGAVRSNASKEPPRKNPDLELLRQRHLSAKGLGDASIEVARTGKQGFQSKPAVAPPSRPAPSVIVQTKAAPVQTTPSQVPPAPQPTTDHQPRRDTVVRRPSILADPNSTSREKDSPEPPAR